MSPKEFRRFFLYSLCLPSKTKSMGPMLRYVASPATGEGGGGVRHAVKRTLWSIRQTLIVNN